MTTLQMTAWRIAAVNDKLYVMSFYKSLWSRRSSYWVNRAPSFDLRLPLQLLSAPNYTVSPSKNIYTSELNVVNTFFHYTTNKRMRYSITPPDDDYATRKWTMIRRYGAEWSDGVAHATNMSTTPYTKVTRHPLNIISNNNYSDCLYARSDDARFMPAWRLWARIKKTLDRKNDPWERPAANTEENSRETTQIAASPNVSWRCGPFTQRIDTSATHQRGFCTC